MLLVEVKATQGEADQIILTKNEVELSRRCSEQMALATVSSISIDEDGRPSGGRLRVEAPWRVREDLLTPIAYYYDLDKH